MAVDFQPTPSLYLTVSRVKDVEEAVSQTCVDWGWKHRMVLKEGASESETSLKISTARKLINRPCKNPVTKWSTQKRTHYKKRTTNLTILAELHCHITSTPQDFVAAPTTISPARVSNCKQVPMRVNPFKNIC